MIKIKIFGINFAVSVGFIGVLCLMLYIDRAALMLPTLTSILFHELGHLISLLALGSPPQMVEIKVGAVAIKGFPTLSFWGNIFMLSAGSAANLLTFLICLVVYLICRSAFLLTFSAVNLVFAIFNSLPVFGLDGGSILYHLISAAVGAKWAKRILFLVSVVICTGIFGVGVAVFIYSKTNPTLILFAIYLFIGTLVAKKQKKDL